MDLIEKVKQKLEFGFSEETKLLISLTFLVKHCISSFLVSSVVCGFLVCLFLFLCVLFCLLFCLVGFVYFVGFLVLFWFVFLKREGKQPRYYNKIINVVNIFNTSRRQGVFVVGDGVTGLFVLELYRWSLHTSAPSCQSIFIWDPSVQVLRN